MKKGTFIVSVWFHIVADCFTVPGAALIVTCCQVKFSGKTGSERQGTESSRGFLRMQRQKKNA